MRKRARTRILGPVSAILGLCLIVCGCQPTLDSGYASPRGTSINGVACFMDILKESGRKADLWPGVSPRMKQDYTSLLLFHNSFEALPEKLSKDILSLMYLGKVRTIVLVVRDSDAEIDYWRQIRDRSEAGSSEFTDASQSYEATRTEFERKSRVHIDADRKSWYGLELADRSADQPLKTIDGSVDGDSFSVQARWPLNRRLVSARNAEVLWKSGDDPLLTVQESVPGRIIVMSSATPLLNGGLVDQGNRRLAAEFIRLFPESGRIAVVLNSQWIEESKGESPGMLRFLKVHPNGFVFGQGILALLLFCWWKYPIFGRPRQTLNVATAQFGRHVEAFGRLLRRSRNVDYARERIRTWHGTQKRHIEPIPEPIKDTQ